MGLSVTPTVDQVVQDVRTFILAVVPANVPVVQGITNRTPMPAPSPGFVVITPLYQERLSWNINTYSASPFPTTQQELQPVRMDLQIDLYGTDAGSWAAMLTTLWRDDFAVNLMVNSQPLYMDEARMIPLMNAEAQWEQRWSLTATLQFNPVVSPAQTFADSVDVTLTSVQEAFPS